MKKIIHLFFSALLLVSFCACNKKPTHQQALDYYARITIEVDSFQSNFNFVTRQFNIASKEAQENGDLGIDSTSFDSLQNFYDTGFLSINSSIEKIKLIKEIDKQIGLKENILNFLNAKRELYKKSFGVTLQLLRNGMNNATDADHEIIEKCKSDFNELEEKRDDIKLIDHQFTDKYNITNEELKKYGIKQKNKKE